MPDQPPLSETHPQTTEFLEHLGAASSSDDDLRRELWDADASVSAYFLYLFSGRTYAEEFQVAKDLAAWKHCGVAFGAVKLRCLTPLNRLLDELPTNLDRREFPCLFISSDPLFQSHLRLSGKLLLNPPFELDREKLFSKLRRLLISMPLRDIPEEICSREFWNPNGSKGDGETKAGTELSEVRHLVTISSPTDHVTV